METKRIAIIGAGPSGMFMFKKILESHTTPVSIHLFEKTNHLGAGMPYSFEGANVEHVTNVSDNEIPLIVNSIQDWIKNVPHATLKKFDIDPERFHEYKVLPRLLFGQYLMAQFESLIRQVKQKNIAVTISRESPVKDLHDDASNAQVTVETDSGERFSFDHAIVCTGHYWSKVNEGKIPGFFDSPYPPKKLEEQRNHTVAMRGSSLTAIDAIRTLARVHGKFIQQPDGTLAYALDDSYKNFRMVMHSRSGLLPAVRFHLEDSHLSKDLDLSQEEIDANRAANDGFLSLDYVFERIFKNALFSRDPEFHEKVRDMNIEQFAETVMAFREKINPFQLLKSEFVQAAKSIKRKEAIHWKEMLAVLSFVMNYPAKYFSAEDTKRLHNILLPLISVVIAFVPQSSCVELIALWEADVLDLIAVGEDSKVVPVESGGIVYHFRSPDDGSLQEVHYETYIDCTGQRHLSFDEFPFKGLIDDHVVSQATVRYSAPEEGKKDMEEGDKNVTVDAHGVYHLRLAGIAINDNFQVVNMYGAHNERVYMMAVPFMGGFNPDYSGLDFCEAASTKIVKSLFK